MAARTPTKRTFDIAVSPDDGLVGIRSAETGRVSLALSLEEASQVRSGLKEPSRPPRRSVRSRAPRKDAPKPSLRRRSGRDALHLSDAVS